VLARTYRLRRSKDIAKVYQRGRYSGGRAFVIKVLETHGPVTRAAIVVSKKVAKSAVVRNTIRRRISGQLEPLWQTVKPGQDIVISVRLDCSADSADQLKAELKQQLDRLGLLTKEA
jgi:ribonuclease P protein component